MITIKCDTCETRFSVEEEFIKDSKVAKPFHCPYNTCQQAYPIGIAYEFVAYLVE